MDTILKNQYVTIYIDRTKLLINDVWNTTSAVMSSDDFKDILYTWKNCIIENRLNKALIDARKMAYLVAPEMQTWIAENINEPAQKAGLRQVATILPSGVFEKVALTQTMKEFQQNQSFQRQVFANELLAKDWLQL
ncbi:hypothetical protein [Microscilla marina]|nr:hypothetical protein [Microscilla marina]